MEPIASGAYSPAAVAGTEELPRIQKPKQPRDESPKPRKDEYVPEEERVPTGLYRLGKDEDGQPKIFFDGPQRVEEEPGQAGGADCPSRSSGGQKPEQCTGSTERVDREIEQLKRKKEELEQQLGTETDEEKRERLERQLSQIERELRQKDNDAYRRQHMVVSQTGGR